MKKNEQKSASLVYNVAAVSTSSVSSFFERYVLSHQKTLIIAIPFLWLIVFYLIPFLFVLKISFALPIIGKPPITSVFSLLDEATLNIKLSFANFNFLLEDKIYLSTYINSIRIAFVSTVLCLFIGYPIAYSLSRIKSQKKIILLIMIIMPLWIPFLIRVYAWIMILKPTGFLNSALIWLGLINEPLHILYTNVAVYIGITYTYMPFMILPLYAILEKMDRSLIEAAADLGCRPFRIFLSIILPLSMPGVIAGSMLVFIPAVGEYVIPELLGGPDNLMIGKLIWNEFFANQDWPIASAFAISLLLILIVPMIVFKIAQNKAEEGAK
jgi:putrescine transport system permease protein